MASTKWAASLLAARLDVNKPRNPIVRVMVECANQLKVVAVDVNDGIPDRQRRHGCGVNAAKGIVHRRNSPRRGAGVLKLIPPARRIVLAQLTCLRAGRRANATAPQSWAAKENGAIA